MAIDWKKSLTDKLLVTAGANCTTLADLVKAVGLELSETVTHDALWAAHRRHKTALKLKESLTDYLNVEARKPDHDPVLGMNDIKFKLSADRRKALKKADRFIITSAMNNTLIDAKLWSSIKQWAKYHKAEIIVVPTRYKNPTSLGEQSTQEYAWWASEVTPYLSDEPVQLHKKLWLMSQVRIQATATYPLSGLEDLTEGNSCVFGHPQLALKMVPSPQSSHPKAMWTTGSVTVPKYSDTKAGIRGGTHHSMGALLVEKDGARFHVRPVQGDEDGGFYDLDRYYHPAGNRKSEGALAMVCGDEHVLFSDPKCQAGTYTDKDSLANITRPAKIVHHDLLDSYSISHHGRFDPLIQYSKHKTGMNSLEAELTKTVDYLNDVVPSWAESLIVDSNHHDHVLRWLKETTPLENPHNMEVWIELWDAIIKSAKFNSKGLMEYTQPFEAWCKDRLKRKVRFLNDDNVTIAGILVSMHGHRGANGSRGSIIQFAKMGIPAITAHSHQPCIYHGAWCVGTGSYLRVDFNDGPSSWAHAQILVHPNGKRQMVFIIDGKYRR